MHILFVTLKITPERHDEFIKEMLLNAKGANENEPGCLRFDVVQDIQDPNTLHLYEVYKDEAAFKDHQNSAHYKRFSEVAGEWRDGPSVLHFGSNVYPTDNDWT